MKCPIDFFVAFSALLPQFLSLGIGLLQFLQPEPYATNADQIKSLIG